MAPIKTKFTPLNLHESTVEKLKALRLLYPSIKGESLTNDALIDKLLNTFLESDKDVKKAFLSYMRKNATK